MRLICLGLLLGLSLASDAKVPFLTAQHDFTLTARTADDKPPIQDRAKIELQEKLVDDLAMLLQSAQTSR